MKRDSLARRKGLIIEVRQAGVAQAGTVLYPGKKKRTITFGRSRRNSLYVAYGKVPTQIHLFKTEDLKVYVLIEPRLRGFVNSGTEFGDIDEFLRPEGAISTLATIADPYPVRLDENSRGVICVGEFEVLFKFDVVQKKKNRFVMSGARANPFSPPAVDSPWENHVVWIALTFAFLLFGPVLFWLVKAPYQHISTISQLPDQFLIQFVHPEHFRYLPKIYGEEYRQRESVSQAVRWVMNLQQRWDAEDLGQTFHSRVPILGPYVREKSSDLIERGWETSRSAEFAVVEKLRTSAGSPRFYRFQSPYPEIVAHTSGAADGSLYLRHLKRIHDLDQAYTSLRNMISKEQEFLNAYLDERGIKRTGLFTNPSRNSDAVEIDEIDPAFEREHDQYSYAEGWARRAERSMFWPTQRLTAAERAREPVVRPSILWLKRSSLISPHFLGQQNGRSANPEQDLIKNAMYSDRKIVIPPPPKPEPFIDMARVEYVLVDRREEIRGCYENALRRNPALQGSMRISWWVALNGKAFDVKIVNSTVMNPQLIHCVENLVLNWNFPKPVHGSVKVSYPFRFVPE